MLVKISRRDGFVVFRHLRQPPGAQDVAGLEHEVPMQEWLVVFEDDEARHGEVLSALDGSRTVESLVL